MVIGPTNCMQESQITTGRDSMRKHSRREKKNQHSQLNVFFFASQRHWISAEYIFNPLKHICK